MVDTNADGSPKVEWKRLIDMPPDVLASRVVGSLILAKGNLNGYKAIIQNMLEAIAKEHADAGYAKSIRTLDDSTSAGKGEARETPYDDPLFVAVDAAHEKDERQRMHDQGVRDGLHPPVPPKHKPVA